MDIVIDEATGLPEVPEGLFWRIRERPKYDQNEIRIDDKELWVELCTDGMVTETYKTRPALSWKNIWIYPLLEDSVDAVREVPGIVVLHDKEMADRDTARFLSPEYEKFKAEGYVEAVRQNHYADSYRYVRLMDPTVENVRKVATSVLETYLAEEKKKAKAEEALKKRQALIGTYPPKKLSDTDD